MPERLLDPALDLTWTLNDVMRRHPASVRVFNAFGLDTCCGGARTLGDALSDAGVDAETILFAIESVVQHDEAPRDGAAAAS